MASPSQNPAPVDVWTKPHQLEQVHQMLASLDKILLQERNAIASLDGEALIRISEQKRACTKSIRQFVSASGILKDSHGPLQRNVLQLRRSISNLSMRVGAGARANAALIHDALEAVGRALGTRGEAETYDRQARKRVGTRSIAGKSI